MSASTTAATRAQTVDVDHRRRRSRPFHATPARDPARSSGCRARGRRVSRSRSQLRRAVEEAELPPIISPSLDRVGVVRVDLADHAPAVHHDQAVAQLQQLVEVEADAAGSPRPGRAARSGGRGRRPRPRCRGRASGRTRPGSAPACAARARACTRCWLPPESASIVLVEPDGARRRGRWVSRLPCSVIRRRRMPAAPLEVAPALQAENEVVADGGEPTSPFARRSSGTWATWRSIRLRRPAFVTSWPLSVDLAAARLSAGR